MLCTVTPRVSPFLTLCLGSAAVLDESHLDLRSLHDQSYLKKQVENGVRREASCECAYVLNGLYMVPLSSMKEILVTYIHSRHKHLLPHFHRFVYRTNNVK